MFVTVQPSVQPSPYRFIHMPLAARLMMMFFMILMGGWSTRGEDPASNNVVSFNRDVRPLLASKCFACHGPDEEHRAAGLRLDERSSAVEYGAIDLKSPAESEILHRIVSTDDDLRMPPPEAGAPLTTAQQDIIDRWIRQGADYQPHWAFQLPQRPRVPVVETSRW
ncbi:MAG: c-type cytochrome domain-containing protein, partial [Planctomycetota bacterium]